VATALSEQRSDRGLFFALEPDRQARTRHWSGCGQRFRKARWLVHRTPARWQLRVLNVIVQKRFQAKRKASDYDRRTPAASCGAAEVLNAILIIRPETLVRWHRAG
jgi:hypothetical protein